MTFLLNNYIHRFLFVKFSSEIFKNYFNVFKKNFMSRNVHHADVIPRARWANRRNGFHVTHLIFFISLFLSKEKYIYTIISHIKSKILLLNFTHVILCEEYNGVSREESSVASCTQIAKYFVKLTFFLKNAASSLYLSISLQKYL